MGQAVTEAAAAERAAPDQAETLALLGDVSFRRADFETAEGYFDAALAADSKCARAHLGLGRLDLLHFRRRSALQHFVAAYSLNPSDPEAVLAYSSAVSDPKQEASLLERYLAVGKGLPREARESALGRLQLLQRLGPRRLAVLDGPYGPYRLHMTDWVPQPGSALGVLLAVSINGGKPLHLLLDTGAPGIVISSRAAEGLGLEYLAEAGLRGVGESGIETRKTLAGSVRVGDLHLQNCVVEVASGAVADQVDGVVGASLFQQFIIRLDARRKILELLPYPDEAARAGRESNVSAGMENLVPVFQAGHLLLVNARFDAFSSGYLILDTGAAFSSVSRRLTPVEEPEFEVSGPGGGRATAYLAGPVRVRVGNRDLLDANAVALDFARLSNVHGVEISGLIGYPMLSRYALTLDYRDGLIGFERSR
jgi:tetratricopeptide (TPR) repeat protein